MEVGRRSGFTLIELMIVIAIIAIIAAIAIPNMLRARLSAQEASAVATLRTISSAQVAAQAQVLFPDSTTMIGLYGSFTEFAGVDDPKPLDDLITNPPHIKSGYEFSMTFVGQTQNEPNYQAFAAPLTPGTSPRNFYTDASGVIRYTTDGSVPNSNSQSI
ncbi:MAG: prepilin-type N-terminal cleavage/methylation domain-containing protein [Candidatus Hydrogenedentota bacterium]